MPLKHDLDGYNQQLTSNFFRPTPDDIKHRPKPRVTRYI